jgi:uncharacterized protein (TIGR03437 family)
MKSHIRTVSLPRLFALSLALALAAPLAAQRDWVTQQAARLVIGQTSFTRQDPTSSQSSIGSAGGVAVAGNRLFIAEGNRIGASPVNNRVLVYNDLASFIPDITDVPPQEKTCPVCVGTADVVLGQPNFTTFTAATTQTGMRAPSGVASDGTILAVADTNNNRVLVWRSIPTANTTPPDLVLGQPDFTTFTPGTTSQKMRGPQGVWIDGGRLFVADTQNSRVLIWTSIPGSNGAAANVVVGQPDFTTQPEPDLTQADYQPSAQNMLDPVSVTVDNHGRMFVADLGFDRVLIFFSIPTQDGFPADVVIGQKDMTTAGFSDHDDNPLTPQVRTAVLDMCEQVGPFDDDGSFTPNDDIFPNPIDRDPNPDLDGDGEPDDEPPPLRWPRRCQHTLNFPRFALSDGEKLFIADSGNDRILVYNQIPTQNDGDGIPADVVIGQPDFLALTDAVSPGNLRSPTSLAHDGTNLYVADPFVRRVLVFSPGDPIVAQEGIVNGASFEVKATGWVEYQDATTDSGQLITLDLSGRPYEFRTETNETALSVRDKLIAMINADEDGLVKATPFNGPGTFARGRIKFDGAIRGGDLLRLRIGDRTYELTTSDSDVPLGMVDRFNFIIDADPHPLVIVDRDPAEISTLLITARDPGPAANSIGLSIEIPAGSPLTVALSNPNTDVSAEVGSLGGGAFPYRIRLTALMGGRPGNGVTITNTVGGAGVVGATSGGRLTGGSNARQLPNGSFASIFGENLSDELMFAPLDAEGMLPTELNGVQVFVNGRAAPIYSLAPTQVNIQIPWEIEGIGSSTFVRRVLPSGEVLVSVPRANETARAAPGIFAYPGDEPRRAVALHGQSQAQGRIGISQGSSSTAEDGSVNAGGTVTITVNGRAYAYTTVSGDSLTSVRDRLIEAINANGGDPEVSASPGQDGFFSARADINFTGEPAAGDVVTITVNGREYSYTAQEGDTLAVIRNILVNTINAGRGDPDVTARRLELVGLVVMQVVARGLGVQTNDITFAVSASSGAGVQVETNVEEGKLEGGQTPPEVILTARQAGREANAITYGATTSDATIVGATARSSQLCCGNIPFSLITDENPAIPGETIIVYASGLGFTKTKPLDQGIESGEVTPPVEPTEPIQVPFIADDFVSSLAGGRTAQVQYAGLAPGLVGVYQINLRLNEQLPDDPETPLDIAQVLFISNTVTIPVKNLVPRDPDTL